MQPGSNYQKFVYNASWDGTSLTANEGTDAILGPIINTGYRGFTATKDKIEIDVTAPAGTTQADILAQISVTHSDVNADGHMDSSVHFGNTNIDVLGTNLSSDLAFINIHFI